MYASISPAVVGLLARHVEPHYSDRQAPQTIKSSNNCVGEAILIF